MRGGAASEGDTSELTLLHCGRAKEGLEHGWADRDSVAVVPPEQVQLRHVHQGAQLAHERRVHQEPAECQRFEPGEAPQTFGQVVQRHGPAGRGQPFQPSGRDQDEKLSDMRTGRFERGKADAEVIQLESQCTRDPSSELLRLGQSPDEAAAQIRWHHRRHEGQGAYAPPGSQIVLGGLIQGLDECAQRRDALDAHVSQECCLPHGGEAGMHPNPCRASPGGHNHT